MHAFKNALIPVFTLAGVNIVVMVNAAVIIEVIFAWPGVGRLLYEGIFQRDFPLVQGVVVMAGFMIVGDQPGRGRALRVHRPTHPAREVARHGHCDPSDDGRRDARRAGSEAAVKAVREAPLLAVVHPRRPGPRRAASPTSSPRTTRPCRCKGAEIFAPPAWMQGGRLATPLGTDFQGRDILSRLIHGARVSLIVGLMGTLVAGGIGTLMGILAGYVGGWVDQIIMRVTDAWLALPAIVFAIFLAAMIGPSMWNIIAILGGVYWTRYARVIRGEVLTLREREFVKLAEIAGASRFRVIKRHILPNVMNTATVLASLTVGVVIIAEASLSFLGLGVPPPQPAWGLMLSEARPTLMAGQWWLTVFPGVVHPADRARHPALRRLAARPPRPPDAKPVVSRGLRRSRLRGRRRLILEVTDLRTTSSPSAARGSSRRWTA